RPYRRREARAHRRGGARAGAVRADRARRRLPGVLHAPGVRAAAVTGAAVAIESRGRVRSAGRDALVAVAALTLLAAALRFSTLGLQSYWYNEAATALLTKLSLGDMLDRIPRMEGNPPLYYVLAWAWAKAFGTGEVGLRSLSAVCGTAMVPAAYVAGARLANARAGVALAALAACRPLLVWFSQEARPYIVLALLTALALIAFVRSL